MERTPEPDVQTSAEAPRGGTLTPWSKGDLPDAPRGGWRIWVGLLGPGVLLAGASIGSGEWLFGPAVSAQYGATLLWLATLSILGQIFVNLEAMRYTLYCGEPVMTGFFRTRPGPVFWTLVYAALDFSAIWPYNASNAAVPLAAAMLGRLPGKGTVELPGLSLSEPTFVMVLGYAIFVLAFVPLIFGGTVYRMLEKVFTFKLVITLLYLVFFAALWVSAANFWEVCSGFFRFGQVPLRAETVIAGRHFTYTGREPAAVCVLKGTIERSSPLITEFSIRAEGQPASEAKVYKLDEKRSPEHAAIEQRWLSHVLTLVEPGRFLLEDWHGRLQVRGTISPSQSWQLERILVRDPAGNRDYTRIEDLPDAELAAHARTLVENQGVARRGLIDYFRNRRREGLPELNWAIIAAFVAIAGTGGLTNLSFSNYARDKGWGMGARVGAIPSAVGARTITLSHTGMVFTVDAESRRRWRGWMRHILRDQLAVWMFCSFVGMALPCMLSLQFIRNAPVEGTRVAAMTADGMAEQFPELRFLLWSATLLIGFLVLAPGQIMASDQIARRWTDIIWTTNRRVQKWGGGNVKYIYYGILAVYFVWGSIVILARFSPLLIATVGATLQSVALGVAAWHTLYVNRTLLPPELRPNWFMQSGLVFCGLVFLGVSLLVVIT